MTRASVVLPVPGGPHRMIDCRGRVRSPRAAAAGAEDASCPTTSSRARAASARRGSRGGPGPGQDPRGGGGPNANQGGQRRSATATFSDSTVDGHRDGHAHAAPGDDLVAQAGALAANEQADGSAPVDVVRILAAARDRRRSFAACVGHAVHDRLGGHARDHRQPQRAAHAAAQGLPGERAGRGAADERAGAPPASAARIRADVARILHVDAVTTNACGCPQMIAGAVTLRRTMAAMPDGDFTGLSAANTLSSAATTSIADALERVRELAPPRPGASLDAATTSTSNTAPAACASRTRCAPSSSMRSPVGSGSSASARNVRTMGFCRLEMDFTLVGYVTVGFR